MNRPLMPEIKILRKNTVKTILCGEGNTLLKELQENGFDIYSPCGGNGTCGKCMVYVKGEGEVTSCIYQVTNDIEIVLPEKREANILVDQHEYTIEMQFNPGDSVGLSSFPYGVAIDIGTTTLVFHLVNLITGAIIETRAVVNPQTKFGADVISRINYSATTSGGLKALQKEILNAINQQLDHFIEVAEITANELVKISIAGNTTMLHLLLGVDPLPIALAPFTPAFVDEQILKGRDLNLHCHREAEIKVLPSVAAYVGADIVAGIASIKPSVEYQRFLFMDIGTNGELALVTPETIWCCATAAGPAFEGANISCGMSAVEGAISVFGADGYSVIGNAAPAGLCGSGLIDVVAHLVENKLVQSDGLLSEDFVIVPETSEKNSIVLTQQDIREVQLAKSAIMAGVKVLLKKASLTFEGLDALFLAGGFGNYIDLASAVKIGMLPKEMEHKTISLGNTSGTGALLALKSVQFDQIIQDVRNRSCYVELSEDEDFVLDYVMNMDFEV
ncbi:MAG: ASKHA domain-containing protein [Prolixibacteraceae bacterium]|nr:ASKHA domain-containing protein [Prolixibacteraceae bacterium]